METVPDGKRPGGILLSVTGGKFLRVKRTFVGCFKIKKWAPKVKKIESGSTLLTISIGTFYPISRASCTEDETVVSSRLTPPQSSIKTMGWPREGSTPLLRLITSRDRKSTRLNSSHIPLS